MHNDFILIKELYCMDSGKATKDIVYYFKPGTENTATTVEKAVERARELGISTYVIASTSGASALSLHNLIDEKKDRIVAVSHHVGFREKGVDPMTPDQRENLRAHGIHVLTTGHALSGVGRGITNKFGYLSPQELMAATLRMFGQGVKVTAEIAIMAADAGMIPMNGDIMVIGGTGKGADTACVITPSHSNHVFDMHIKEIVCKPL